MTTQGGNYSVTDTGPLEGLPERELNGVYGKYFTRKELGLTGCEVSLNCLPAGAATPFVHAHKLNEEVYIVVRGGGTCYVDGDEFPVREGSVIRVAPAGARALQAGEHGLYYICVQAQAGSLTRATFDDGFKVEARPSWM